jgi:hypothetical protein
MSQVPDRSPFNLESDFKSLLLRPLAANDVPACPCIAVLTNTSTGVEAAGEAIEKCVTGCASRTPAVDFAVQFIAKVRCIYRIGTALGNQSILWIRQAVICRDRTSTLLQGAFVGGTAFNSGGLNAMRVNEPCILVYWFADQYLQVSPPLLPTPMMHTNLWNIRCNFLHRTVHDLAADSTGLRSFL